MYVVSANICPVSFNIVISLKFVWRLKSRLKQEPLKKKYLTIDEMHLLNFLTGYRLTFEFKSTHKYKIRGTKFRVKFGQNLVVERQICKTLFALRREIKKQ